MRLDFNVLWVEDQPRLVQSQIKVIATHMKDHGFEFQPTLCRSMDEVRGRVADSVFTDEIDLILVDWDLGEHVEGQTAISEIREHIQYKDVIFYSANNAVNELRKLAFASELEGIYYVTREGLVDEVVGVFESLVKKVLDLDHVRGIVMGATSDIDYMVTECLLRLHNNADSGGKQSLLTDALNRVDRKLEELVESIDKLKKVDAFPKVLEVHAVFTANDRLRMLSQLLEDDALKAHAGYRPDVTAYIANVVPDRNILGHRILTPEGKPMSVVNNRGRPISLNETRALRRRLLELRLRFRELLLALQGPI